MSADIPLEPIKPWPAFAYDSPAGYRYASRWPGEEAHFHPRCLVDEMVDRRELSPAARDMEPEDVLNQHGGANGYVREQGEVYSAPDDADMFDVQEFPLSVWPSNDLETQSCGRCQRPILERPELQEWQHVARDLAAADRASDRNDHDPAWFQWADQKYGPQAKQHVVAFEAIREFRNQGAVSEWARDSPHTPREQLGAPDSIELLRARLAAPPSIQHHRT